MGDLCIDDAVCVPYDKMAREDDDHTSRTIDELIEALETYHDDQAVLLKKAQDEEPNEAASS